MNNIASALEAHVREASVRGWALPQQLYPPASGDDSGLGEGWKAGESREGIGVKGMWPYWLDGRSASTVRNTLDLRNMVILTGLAQSAAHPCGLVSASATLHDCNSHKRG